MKKKVKIGDYRLLPKNTFVWSIGLQEIVSFAEDMVIEVTNFTQPVDSVIIYSKLKTLLFNHAGYIPTLIDKTNGELGAMKLDRTLEYKIPAPMMER